MTEMTKIAGVETPIEVARLINVLVDNKGNIDLDNLSETGLAKFTNLDTKITNVQENVNALTTTVNEKIGATVSKAQNGYIKFTNGVIIQWGYLTNIPYGQEIYFPISFKQITRCTVNLINPGYCFINTIAVTTSYFSTSVYTSLQQRINGNIMWLAIGF